MVVFFHGEPIVEPDCSLDVDAQTLRQLWKARLRMNGAILGFLQLLLLWKDFYHKRLFTNVTCHKNTIFVSQRLKVLE